MVSAPPDKRTPSSRLIVCEKSGEWSAWLRRLDANGGRWIVQCDNLVELNRCLAEHMASLCILEADGDNVIDVVGALAGCRQRWPDAHFLVGCRREASPYVTDFREAGAVGVMNSPRQGDAIWRLWRRHALRFPPREETFIDRLLAQLPW